MALRVTCPVMRVIGVRDKARAGAFYRDVLGFSLGETADGALEAASGAARVQFGEHGYEADRWDVPRQPGESTLFLETDELDEWRRTLIARGARPSQPVRVNRVKMRMFELNDPDGNTIWFGESYDRPDLTASPDVLEKALPQLPFDNVPEAVAYYRDVLGFHVNYQQDDTGVMDRGAVTVLLIARTPRHSGTGSAYFYVHDADALYHELKNRKANLQGEPVSRPWGLREFAILDLAGNELTFGQPFE